MFFTIKLKEQDLDFVVDQSGGETSERFLSLD